jgi:hypothetical protein
MATTPLQGKPRFRNSFTFKAGTVPGVIVQGRVVGLNLVNWTVNVISQFDRLRMFDIQVGAPYAHPNRGEGIYALPEVGATCMVTVPSDSTPPFVSSFVMPIEQINTSASDAPLGTSSLGKPAQNATDATFAGGRMKGKPGDIVMRGRDGNQIILHRGGVLQIGASEVAQRIYIPLGNQIVDFSEQYSHHNAGGSILWGLQEGPSTEHQATQYSEIFRVYADDKFADIRITKGKVFLPVGEPTGDDGELEDVEAFGIGVEDVSILEVAVAPGGFSGNAGTDDNNARQNSVFRFFFDRKGNTFFRCKGNMLASVKKKLRLKVTDTMEILGQKNMSMRFATGVDIDGGAYVHIKGGIIRLGAGTRPAAGIGDAVLIALPAANMTGTVGGSAFEGVVTFATMVPGTITSGEPTVLI